MSAFAELGFARGATDKLMGRARDESPPSEVKTKSAVTAYKKAYVRGYDETLLPGDAVGASISFSASTSTSASSAPKTSAPAPGTPGSEGTADQGFSATLPEKTAVTRLKPLALFAAKPAISVATRQTASALGTPAPAPTRATPTLSETMPATTLAEQLATPPGQLPTMQLEVAPPTTALAPATFADKAKAWWSENWKTVAIGTAAVVVVGGVVYVVTKKSDSTLA